MNKYDLFYCTKTLRMNTGEIGFKKGKFYKGVLLGFHGNFKSEISNEMKHSMNYELIAEHLKIFKFGR